MDINMESEKTVLTPPIKIRKKPGRKPNPASPALRKAQNRAAQRAFRERKENYIKELENANKKLQEQKDKFQTETQELKVEVEILRSENWYLKGIVLTLHLLCFQHNLVIPQHGPFFSDKVLSLLTKSIPKSIASYMDLHCIGKLPKPENVFSLKDNIKQGNTVLSSSFSVAVTKDGIRPLSDTVGFKPDMGSVVHIENSESVNTMCDANPSVDDLVHPLERNSTAPPLSPASDNSIPDNDRYNKLLQPVMLTNEPITSNLAAIQALRLRLRLQNIRARTDANSFVIRPTLLQLTVPHDPRIDLLPTPHMRDRMILYRDRFDLDDCFRCLLEKSKFHGGDPAVAANWELPPEFFEKYWFLTIDYDLRRTTNKWRSLQGLSELELENSKAVTPELKTSDLSKNQQPPILESPEPSNLNYNDISPLLNFDFMRFNQQNNTTLNNSQSTTSSSTYEEEKEEESISIPATTDIDMPTIEPVLLTDASIIPGTKPVMKATTTTTTHKPRRHHPYFNDRSKNNSNSLFDTCNPWDNPLYRQRECDMLIDRLTNPEHSS